MVYIRPLVESRPPFADGGEGSVHGVAFAAATDGFETLADGLDYGGSHGFAGFAG